MSIEGFDLTLAVNVDREAYVKYGHPAGTELVENGEYNIDLSETETEILDRAGVKPDDVNFCVVWRIENDQAVGRVEFSEPRFSAPKCPLCGREPARHSYNAGKLYCPACGWFEGMPLAGLLGELREALDKLDAGIAEAKGGKGKA
jgi:predicted RNA-binding Zn-ribbon protein involved in translation (DUF1610 family)